MDTALIQPLLGVISVLVGILVLLTGWIGSRIFQRMDQIQVILREAEKDLHVRIDDHEHRITRTEVHLDIKRQTQ